MIFPVLILSFALHVCIETKEKKYNTGLTRQIWNEFTHLHQRGVADCDSGDKFGPKALYQVYLFHQSRYRALDTNLANITFRCTNFHWRSWSSATAGLRSSCTVDCHEQADGDNVHPVLGEEGPNRNFHITKSIFFCFADLKNRNLDLRTQMNADPTGSGPK